MHMLFRKTRNRYAKTLGSLKTSNRIKPLAKKTDFLQLNIGIECCHHEDRQKTYENILSSSPSLVYILAWLMISFKGHSDLYRLGGGWASYMGMWLRTETWTNTYIYTQLCSNCLPTAIKWPSDSFFYLCTSSSSIMGYDLIDSPWTLTIGTSFGNDHSSTSQIMRPDISSLDAIKSRKFSYIKSWDLKAGI